MRNGQELLHPAVDRTPISIIIPAFNQVAYCQACIASLRRCTLREYRLILVDNGSTDGAGPFFDSVEDATVIHTGENLGFAGGVNQGLNRAAGHIVLLNSDTLLTPGWLDRLEAALLSADDIGMAGPMSNCAAGPQQIDGLSLNSEPVLDAFAEEWTRRNAGRVRDVNRLVGFCMMIRDNAFRRAGMFDESFGIGNFEDDDYCTRLRKEGFRLVIAEDCFVFHHGGRTFQGMGLTGDAFEQLLAENRRRFEEKWGVHVPNPPAAQRRAQRLNEQARQALADGNPLEAIRLLRAAIEIRPEEAQHYNDLGVILWQTGRIGLARQCFQQALQCNPEYTEARDNLASLDQNPIV